MATTLLEENPVELTPEQTSQNLGATPAPFLTTTASNEVYASPNIQQIDIPGNKKAMDMKLSKLEDKLAKANSISELNQISIMNQPKAMGVLTGEAAYRSKLDSARLNAFNSLYQNRLLEEQRKEAERQQFMQTYGADPKKRPKGMSKREFVKALAGGKFQDLVSPEFKAAQEEKAIDLALKKKQLAGGGTATEKTGAIISQAQNALINSRGNDGFVDPGVYMNFRSQYASQAGDVLGFDKQFANLLSPKEQENLGLSTSGSVDQWAEMLSKGQATVANVPTAIRDSVVQRVSELGTGVNKQMSDTAITEISQTKAALSSLDDLQSKITENQNDLGPITGLEAYNPWSEKRKIQADIDRVRQVVGKALEGGVLRKEDEEKYKKILATITDTPETALYKIEALKSDIQRKIDEYISLQAGAGRYTGGIQTGADAENLRTKYNY